MNKKNSISFIDRHNKKQTLYVSQSEKLKNEMLKLRELKKINNKRQLSFQKQLISKLKDLEHPYCNLFINDFFKYKYERIFIQEILPIIETLASKKSISTAKRYIRSLKNFLIYLRNVKYKISRIADISKEFLIKFHGDVLNGNGFIEELEYSQRALVYSFIVNLLKLYFDDNIDKSFKTLSIPAKKRTPRKAYSVEFSKILYSTCVYIMDQTISNYNKYQKLKKKYKGKVFYSYENLCFSYLKYKKLKKQFTRLMFLNKVCKSKYGKDLSLYSNEYLLKEGINGIDVNLFDKKSI